MNVAGITVRFVASPTGAGKDRRVGKTVPIGKMCFFRLIRLSSIFQADNYPCGATKERFSFSVWFAG